MLIQPVQTETQLSQLLKSARKRNGLTQAEVGARLALSQNRISHLEAHTEELSFKQLLTWCAVVGLELHLVQRGEVPNPIATADRDSTAESAEW